MKITNSSIFPLPYNTDFIHLGTILDNGKEYFVFVSVRGSCKGKCYIEEFHSISNSLTFIEDDNLAIDLARFAEEKGITDIPKRITELGETKRLWLLD